MKTLTAWPWPGNVRELENLMERSVILTHGGCSACSRFGNAQRRPGRPPQARHNLENVEREHILRVLRETKGAISGPDGAAARLGLKRTTLQSKMQRLKITRQDYMDS